MDSNPRLGSEGAAPAIPPWRSGLSASGLRASERGFGKDFVVVQWDQRGAGKSYPPNLRTDQMRIDQFVADTHELTELLLQRFGGHKCYLVAHSSGLIVAGKLVAEHPELFAPISPSGRWRFPLKASKSVTDSRSPRPERNRTRASFVNCNIWARHPTATSRRPIAWNLGCSIMRGRNTSRPVARSLSDSRFSHRSIPGSISRAFRSARRSRSRAFGGNPFMR